MTFLHLAYNAARLARTGTRAYRLAHMNRVTNNTNNTGAAEFVARRQRMIRRFDSTDPYHDRSPRRKPLIQFLLVAINTILLVAFVFTPWATFHNSVDPPSYSSSSSQTITPLRMSFSFLEFCNTTTTSVSRMPTTTPMGGSPTTRSQCESFVSLMGRINGNRGCISSDSQFWYWMSFGAAMGAAFALFIALLIAGARLISPESTFHDLRPIPELRRNAVLQRRTIGQTDATGNEGEMTAIDAGNIIVEGGNNINDEVDQRGQQERRNVQGVASDVAVEVASSPAENPSNATNIYPSSAAASSNDRQHSSQQQTAQDFYLGRFRNLEPAVIVNVLAALEGQSAGIIEETLSRMNDEAAAIHRNNPRQEHPGQHESATQINNSNNTFANTNVNNYNNAIPGVAVVPPQNFILHQQQQQQPQLSPHQFQVPQQHHLVIPPQNTTNVAARDTRLCPTILRVFFVTSLCMCISGVVIAVVNIVIHGLHQKDCFLSQCAFFDNRQVTLSAAGFQNGPSVYLMAASIGVSVICCCVEMMMMNPFSEREPNGVLACMLDSFGCCCCCDYGDEEYADDEEDPGFDELEEINNNNNSSNYYQYPQQQNIGDINAMHQQNYVYYQASPQQGIPLDWHHAQHHQRHYNFQQAPPPVFQGTLIQATDTVNNNNHSGNQFSPFAATSSLAPTRQPASFPSLPAPPPPRPHETVVSPPMATGNINNGNEEHNATVSAEPANSLAVDVSVPKRTNSRKNGNDDDDQDDEDHQQQSTLKSANKDIEVRMNGEADGNTNDNEKLAVNNGNDVNGTANEHENTAAGLELSLAPPLPQPDEVPMLEDVANVNTKGDEEKQ